MRAEIIIEATKPRTMRELLDQRNVFKAALRVVSAQNRHNKNVDAILDPYCDRINELEEMAPNMPLWSLSDVLDALDFYEAMMEPHASDYADGRDQRLLASIRKAIALIEKHEPITQRARAALRDAENSAPAKTDDAEPISAIDIADRINEVRHSLALVLEIVEGKTREPRSDEGRAAANGLVDLVYQQLDRLAELRDRVHPED